MTSLAESDEDSTFYAISDVEHIAKTAIRAARPADRDYAWKEYQATCRAVTEASPDLMPWEDPEEVTRISARHAKRVLEAVILSVPDKAEQARLAKIAAREAERVEKRMERDGTPGSSIPGGKYPVRHCGHCGRPYRPKAASSKWCSASCRVGAHKARKRAAEANG